MKAKGLIPEHLEGREFLSKKAGSFSGVPQRNVQFWTKKGVITPNIEDTTGPGIHRKYDTLNCIEVGITDSMAKNRVPLEIIKECIKFLRTAEISESGPRVGKWYELEKYSDLLPYTQSLVIHFNDTEDTKKPLKHKIELSRVAAVARPEYDKTLIVNIVRIAKKVISKIGG